MELNLGLLGFDDFLHWHAQRTGSLSFNWEDPNHRNAYVAWEQQTRAAVGGTAVAPLRAPRTMMMAPQTPIAPHVFGPLEEIIKEEPKVHNAKEEIDSVVAAQPGSGVEAEPPKLVAARDYYHGVVEEQGAAYDQH